MDVAAGVLPRAMRLGTVGHDRRQTRRTPDARHIARAHHRDREMNNLRARLPKDAAAIALGADRVARALAEACRAREISLDIKRTGSRGMFWLEPLLEIETTTGAVSFGPIAPGDIDSILESVLAN